MVKNIFLLFLFSSAFFLSSLGPTFAKTAVKTSDHNKDGRPDFWEYDDASGHTQKTARDIDYDGKPDQFTEFLKGRSLIMREDDRNRDGKIDKRSLMQWEPNKSITVYNAGRMQKIPNPGYRTLWSEEDNDYDGKVDMYREQGVKKPKSLRIGQPIEGKVQKP